MVQREIADRLRAAPGSRTYGSPSVVAQLACEVELVRKVDPAVFRPRPRVDSAILRLRRTGPGGDEATRALIRAAFAHRRKSLARSLEHGRAGIAGAGAGGARRARTARRRAGGGAFARGLRRSFRQAPGRPLIPAAAMLVHAPAKLNLCLYLGRRREDGLHELCSLFEPLALADLIEVSRGRARRGPLPRGRGREPRRGGAGGAARARLGAGAAAGRDREAGPGRRRARRRQRRRRRGPAPRGRRGAGHRGDRRRARRRRALAAAARRWRSSAAPARSSSRCPLPPVHAALLLPDGGGLGTADVFAEADRLELGRERRGARRAGRAAARGWPAPAPRRSPIPSCSSTTSSRRRARCGRRSATRSTSCARPAPRWPC